MLAHAIPLSRIESARLLPPRDRHTGPAQVRDQACAMEVRYVAIRKAHRAPCAFSEGGDASRVADRVVRPDVDEIGDLAKHIAELPGRQFTHRTWLGIHDCIPGGR